MTSEWQLRIWLGASASPGNPAFVAAMLRDIHADDASANAWMRQPRSELDGRSAEFTMATGDIRAVERLLVREWWAASSAQSAAA